MYQITISCTDRQICKKFGIFNERDTFFVRSSDEVCKIIKSIPAKYFISLIEFNFDSVDDVVKSVCSHDV